MRQSLFRGHWKDCWASLWRENTGGDPIKAVCAVHIYELRLDQAIAKTFAIACAAKTEYAPLSLWQPLLGAMMGKEDSGGWNRSQERLLAVFSPDLNSISCLT